MAVVVSHHPIFPPCFQPVTRIHHDPMPTSRPPATPRTDDPRCHVSVGGLRLKNPLICGSGEHTITAAGMQALLQAGAAAVVAKSVNESEAARKQLDGTDYVLLDAAWKPLPWDFSPPPDAQLFCRSGLFPGRFEDWLTMVAELDRQAAASDAYVIPSLILADLDACIDYALRIEAAGLRVLELNIGAPHGPEAARGAIVTERAASRVLEITRRMRAAIGIPLWIKLTGQSEDVVALAQAAQQGGADAVIMMGRFLGMVPDIETQAPLLGTSAALGGPWALALTARWLAMTRKAAGPELPLIATNGARSGEDIVRFLLAGACAVEMTSAVMAGGSRVVRESLQALSAYLAQRQQDASALIGLAADRLQGYAEQAPRPDYWQRFVSAEARSITVEEQHSPAITERGKQ